MKRNGFCLPLHYLQVGAWVTVALLAALYYSLIVPNLPERSHIPLLLLYSLAFAVVLVAGFISTKTDPTDIAVQVKLGILSLSYDYSKYPRLCIKCSTHVGARSKHCNKCGRCAADFDHHCDWLNNCIGQANYRWFVALITSLEFCVLMELAGTLVMVKYVFEDETQGREVREKYGVGEDGYLFVFMLIFVAVVCVSIATSNGYLILFHGYLRARGLTTYEFIVMRRSPKQKVSPTRAEIRYDQSTIQLQLELQLPASDSRPIVPHCTPIESVPKSVEPKESDCHNMNIGKPALSRTIDVSSLPSFVERPTELEAGASYQHRKAREDSVIPMDEEHEFLPDYESSILRQRQHSSPADA